MIRWDEGLLKVAYILVSPFSGRIEVSSDVLSSNPFPDENKTWEDITETEDSAEVSFESRRSTVKGLLWENSIIVTRLILQNKVVKRVIYLLSKNRVSPKYMHEMLNTIPKPYYPNKSQDAQACPMDDGTLSSNIH